MDDQGNARFKMASGETRTVHKFKLLMASFALWLVGLALVLGRIRNDWCRWSLTTDDPDGALNWIMNYW